MYTTRHYQSVADFMRHEREAIERQPGPADIFRGRMIEWNRIRLMMGLMFKADNPRFKPELFDRACGAPENSSENS